MNEILMKAIVEYGAFLSLTSDDDLNPDIAVSEMEQLIAMLRELSPKDVSALANYINKVIANEKDVHRVEFLKTFVQNLLPED